MIDPTRHAFCAASDSFEWEHMSSDRRGSQRKLAELEVERLARLDLASNMMANVEAQTQVGLHMYSPHLKITLYSDSPEGTA